MLQHCSAIAALMLLATTGASAAEYRCPVQAKRSLERAYTPDDIAKWKYEVQVTDVGETAWLRRCSISISQDAFTCDEYETDHIAFDKNVGIKKYYVLSSQFDVQIFSDLTFIENNGRGDFAWGRCNIVSP